MLKRAFFSIPLALVLACCSNGDEPLKIVFTGDVLLDRGVDNTIERIGVEALFDGVRSVFDDADEVVINLECPLANRETPVNKKYIFRADTSYASQLRRAGVTIANMANNHTMDQGMMGLESTAEALQNAGIETLGYGESIKPLVLHKKGIDVALFGSCTLPIENWVYGKGISQASISDLCSAIADYRKTNRKAKIIIILHWGTEMQTTPSPRQQIEAQQLIAAGADAIIGHHPHVVQPARQIGGRTVWFSLGNFVFDQHYPEARKAQMAYLEIYHDTIIYQTRNVAIVSNCPKLIDEK